MTGYFHFSQGGLDEEGHTIDILVPCGNVFDVERLCGFERL